MQEQNSTPSPAQSPAPDPVLVGLQIANAIWVAVNGTLPRKEGTR